jgi:serine/threonine protein kinase
MHCQFCGAALEKISEACPFCASQVVLGDRYEIRSVLGRGAMGEVFYAYDRRLANDVALKRLNPQLTGSAELRESLTREARIMAKLSDAGIVRLFDLADYESGLYLVLEYVCGPNLREMLKAGYRASPAEMLGAMSQICQALTAAHQQGVIHRDLKPSNLLVSLRGAEREAFVDSRRLPATLANANIKIADFGIAKAIAESKSTLTNAFSGTPGYMAPEQFRGETPSPATDVYALGVIAFELLTGKLPTQPMPDVPDVHPYVSDVLRRATSAYREQRFQSAAEFYAALYNAVEGRPFQPPVVRPAPAANRKAFVFLACLAGAIALAMTLIFSAVDKPRPVTKLTPLPTIPTFQPEKPIAIVAHSAPRVDALPAPIAEAEGEVPDSGLVGPRKPKIKWSVLLDAISINRSAIGADGTLYAVTMRGEVVAIRDGKLAWAYKTSFGPVAELRFDKQGRLWVKDLNDLFCFNRDGEGGRVPRTMQPPPEHNRPTYHCVQNHTLWGPGIQMDLDADCSSSSVASRPGGPIFVGTDKPEILALNPRGQTLWKMKPSCEPNQIFALANDRLVFVCKEGGGVHNLQGQTESWTHPTSGTVSSHMVADADGVFYYSDSPGSYGKTQLNVLDSNGALLGTADLQGVSLNDLVLGAQKQLYAVGYGLNVRILRLED